MKIFSFLLLVSLVSAIPQRQSFTSGGSGESINANEVSNKRINTDRRVNAANDLTSPPAAAAIAYMKAVGKDGLCGLPLKPN